MSEPLFDTGLQPERTLLAWRRTCLALGVAGAVAIRIAGPQFGGWAIALGVAVIAFAAASYAATGRRYTAVRRRLVEGRPHEGHAVAVLATSMGTALLAMGALAWMIALEVTRG